MEKGYLRNILKLSKQHLALCHSSILVTRKGECMRESSPGIRNKQLEVPKAEKNSEHSRNQSKLSLKYKELELNANVNTVKKTDNILF